MSKETEYKWFDAEHPYIMQTPYGEVGLDEWREANEKWLEKQEPEERVEKEEEK